MALRLIVHVAAITLFCCYNYFLAYDESCKFIVYWIVLSTTRYVS